MKDEKKQSNLREDEATERRLHIAALPGALGAGRPNQQVKSGRGKGSRQGAGLGEACSRKEKQRVQRPRGTSGKASQLQHSKWQAARYEVMEVTRAGLF